MNDLGEMKLLETLLLLLPGFVTDENTGEIRRNDKGQEKRGEGGKNPPEPVDRRPEPTPPPPPPPKQEKSGA